MPTPPDRCLLFTIGASFTWQLGLIWEFTGVGGLSGTALPVWRTSWRHLGWFVSKRTYSGYLPLWTDDRCWMQKDAPWVRHHLQVTLTCTDACEPWGPFCTGCTLLNSGFLSRGSVRWALQKGRMTSPCPLCLCRMDTARSALWAIRCKWTDCLHPIALRSNPAKWREQIPFRLPNWIRLKVGG